MGGGVGVGFVVGFVVGVVVVVVFYFVMNKIYYHRAAVMATKGRGGRDAASRHQPKRAANASITRSLRM